MSANVLMSCLVLATVAPGCGEHDLGAGDPVDAGGDSGTTPPSDAEDAEIDGGPAFAYVFTDLGTLGGSSSGATAINNLGQIVGYATRNDTPECEHAEGPGPCEYPVLWANGSITDLGRVDPVADVAWASAINDEGVIVGCEIDYVTSSSAGTARPFWFHSATMMALPLPEGQLVGCAEAINSAGVIVGFSDDNGSVPNRLVRWTAGIPEVVASSDTLARRGEGINDSGLIVGEEYMPISFRPSNAILHESSATTNLGMEDIQSKAFDINGAGTIAGGQAAQAHSPMQATLWIRTSSGKYDTVSVGGLPGDSSSSLYDINPAGMAVGMSVSPAGVAHAILYADGVLSDLNALAASVPGVMYSAEGINDRGDIVGAYLDAGGQIRAYLLTRQVAP